MKTIGVLASWQVYAGTLNTLLSPILYGINAAAQKGGCNLLLACGVAPPHVPDLQPAWPILAPEVDFVPVGPWNTDGLIVIAPSPDEDIKSRYIQQVIAAGHPVVFAEAAEYGPSVSLDNQGGIFQALEHLKQHGHRQIAFIAGDENRPGDSSERYQAFLSGVKTLGLETDARRIAHGRFTIPGGAQAMQQILSTGAPFSAVVASNDESAIGAIQALRAAGRRVPQDVAVIGFDNRFEARTHSPPLTTIDQPAFEIGYQALELILQTLAGKENKAEVRVPTRLVVRESCGCPHGARLTTPATSQQQLIETMSEAVFAEVGQISPEVIRTQCKSLVQALAISIARGNPKPFVAALNEILQQTEKFYENANAWQPAISALIRDWPILAGAGQLQNRTALVNSWLDQARVQIGERAQQQILRQLAGQNEFTQQLSLMSALGEVIDAAQIQEIMDAYLPGLGIQHARWFLFEPQGNDPVAWSAVPGAPHHRFPTRQFPPSGIYPADQPFRLALLPVTIRKQSVGFATFDAANLAPCVAVVRQLASTLESIRLYQEVSEGRRLAEEANRMKSRFLSTVSHELRTPLNLIVGLSEMQLKEPTADARQALERIHTSAQHLGHLIRDVLDLASSDAGQLHLTCEPLDLVDALQMVTEIGKQLAHEKKLEWCAEFPKNLPRVWGDRLRLQQVALNLVSNAVKFTEHGQVGLQLKLEGHYVVVNVRDTGLGIPPDEQAWIFDEFRQSERTTARGYGGLGLGLAICKRLVELHGGEIGVQSSGKEGAGSTFYFKLPAIESPEVPQPAPAAGAGQSVLILTKTQGASQPLQERLQRAGFFVEVWPMDDSSGWLPLLLAAPPAAVVLDLQIASERGWEILKVLKGSPITEDIPVMFYSLDPTQGMGSVLSIDYLMKPVGSAELFQALTRQGWPDAGQSWAKTILVVDDDPGTLEMNTRMVQAQSAAYRVLTAPNGRAALEILRTTPIDLLLLDLMMPEVDGFGVLAQLRELETNRDTAVVVLTSKTLTDADMVRLNNGVAMVMGKGLYRAEEILTHVEAVLQHSRKLGSESRRLVRKAMAYIHEHYAEPLTRASLARYVGASEGHLARCFNQETGLSPLAYLNRCRVHRAQRLLSTTDQNITAVALAVGFSDSNYFSRVFRQETGVSPLAYRRNQGG